MGMKPDKNLFLLLLSALGISLAVNAYSFLHAPDPGVLASAAGQKFRIDALSDPANGVLKKEAEKWAENLIFSKEAAVHLITVPQLLKMEISDKIKVSQEEVYQRYLHSPAADASAWPQVLKEIENEIRTGREERLKKVFLHKLYPKYRVSFRVREPLNTMRLKTPEFTRFPIYRVPPVAADLSVEGKVIGAPFQGPADAPVALEVYSDFMCPFSHRIFETLRQLHVQYPEKLRIVFRQFPLPFHEGSHLLSEASACGQEQGKFWAIHDRLMGGEPVKQDKAALTQMAQELGMDVPKFRSCVESGKYASWVDSEIDSGKTRGATGTPSYFINGRMGVGVMPMDNFKMFIEWHLKPEGRYPGARDPGQRPSGCGAPPAGNALQGKK